MAGSAVRRQVSWASAAPPQEQGEQGQAVGGEVESCGAQTQTTPARPFTEPQSEAAPGTPTAAFQVIGILFSITFAFKSLSFPLFENIVSSKLLLSVLLFLII